MKSAIVEATGAASARLASEQRGWAAGERTLQWAARFWFTVAVIGQLIFVVYIAVFHGGAWWSGNLEAVNRELPQGYMAGNTLGNAALAAHLVFAAWITLSGALQLIPQIRSRYLLFHRWNGRVYVFVALVMGVTGLYLILSGRKLVGDLSQQVGIGINGVLILIAALMTWRTAAGRRFGDHRRWAMRLFLVVSGVWFFRVGLMFWLFVHRAPVGFDAHTFTGPFLTALSFGQYVLPLAMWELYLSAERSRAAAVKLVTAGAVMAMTVAMGLGIFAATLGMWLPRMR